MKRTPRSPYKTAAALLVAVCAALFGYLNKDIKSKPVSNPFKQQIPVKVVKSSSMTVYRVEKVIDGDTIALNNGEHVRLIGVDAPESRENERAKRVSQRTGQDMQTITALGKASKAYLTNLLTDKQVIIETDVGERDRYQRLLAYVYLPIESAPPSRQYHLVKRNDRDYIFINATLALAGYAAPLTVAPNVQYASLFQSLYNKAREEQNGLWQKKETSKVLAMQP
jgi:micrococcal nuclease